MRDLEVGDVYITVMGKYEIISVSDSFYAVKIKHSGSQFDVTKWVIRDSVKDGGITDVIRKSNSKWDPIIKRMANA